VWLDHGWTAEGYRVHPDGSPMSIRPTSPVYGLGPDFEGDRLLGAWEPRPDVKPDDPRKTIDYVELYHFVNADEGGPFVVGPLTIEETETQASFWLASRVRIRGKGTHRPSKTAGDSLKPSSGSLWSRWLTVERTLFGPAKCRILGAPWAISATTPWQ
jgi:hypothetical protein